MERVVISPLRRSMLRLSYLLIAASFIPLIPPTHWLIEAVTNFSHYLLCFHVISLCLIPFLSGARPLRLFLLASNHIIFAILFLLPILPFLVKIDAKASIEMPNSARILYVNLLTNNHDHSAVIEMIKRTNADILVLLEIGNTWRKSVDQVLANYSTRVESIRDDNFGLAVYSRLGLAGEATDFGDDIAPAFHLPLTTAGGGNLDLYALHCAPPVTPHALHLNRIILRRVASDLRFSDNATLVLGDFNATPHSKYYRDFVNWGSLTNAFEGRGWVSTWDARNRLFNLMIDHALFKGAVTVKQITRMPYVGSDHYPLLVEIQTN